MVRMDIVVEDIMEFEEKYKDALVHAYEDWITNYPSPKMSQDWTIDEWTYAQFGLKDRLAIVVDDMFREIWNDVEESYKELRKSNELDDIPF